MPNCAFRMTGPHGAGRMVRRRRSRSRGPCRN
jgi:hypothetical protein